MKSAEAEGIPDHKVTALRSVLRSTPAKKGVRSRSPLKAAVMQLLPELVALRAKGYNGVELAEIMRENGFAIAAATLNKYINEARSSSKTRPKKSRAKTATNSKPAVATPEVRASDAVEKIVVPPSLLATKPASNAKKTAKDVLGHRFDDEL